MNTNISLNILVVCTAFSPENAVGSIRLTKIVKYLVRAGHKVTVVSPTLHEGTKIDNSLECPELQSASRIQVSQSSLFNKLFLRQRNSMLNKKTALEYIKSDTRQNLTSILKTSIYRILQYVYSIIRNLDWKYQVVNFSQAHFARQEFDIVFSSYPSLGAHWAAMALREKGIAKIWVADFRDPINYEISSNVVTFSLNTLIQNSILKRSDHITYISNGIAIKFGGKVTPDKFTMVPNGYDESDVNTNTAPGLCHAEKDILTFCYVGSLYGGERDLSILFQTMRELISTGKISAERIRFIYAGKEFDVLNQQALPFGMAHILDNRGFVSRDESLLLQQLSDITIVVSWNTEKDQGIISGKLFECFVTRKIIVGIVNGTKPSSELAEIINLVNGGFVFEHASPSREKEYQALLDFLQQKYCEKMKCGALQDTYNNNVETYSYKNITNKFINIFQK